MISYNSGDVVQCMRQYDMFANSLNLVKGANEKEKIVKQLTKLEEKIIKITNDIYEEEYYTLANKQCSLLNEEKNRITMLIDLINQRISYVEKRCNNHYRLTGESIDVEEVLGSLELDNLENRVRIIDKYVKNKKLETELNDDVKSLSNKIALASEKIEINKSLNVELEATFKKVLASAFEKLSLYDLLDEKDNILYAYYETEKSLDLARQNLEIAKTSPMNILNDCETMYNDVNNDYAYYKDKVNTLRLMESFNKDVDNYDELIEKRKEINDYLKYINNQELINLIKDTIDKQYATILMEEQDINTCNDLIIEKDRKLEALKEIEEENNSDEFQNVLKVLIENEKKKQEKMLEEQRKIEEEEKKKKLEIERKRQEEILKRQRIIEEARKKEIEKRTKKMLEEQHKSFIQSKKPEKEVSFENIKDDSLNNIEVVEEPKNVDSRKELVLNLNNLKQETMMNDNLDSQDSQNFVAYKNKTEIENELFDEFNSRQEKNQHEYNTVSDDNNKFFEPKLSKIDTDINAMLEKTDDNDNKFPDMSIDEYMRSFDENKVKSMDNIFAEDDFPTIPM